MKIVKLIFKDNKEFHVFEQERVLIGRDKEAKIFLNDRTVSHIHAWIYCKDGIFYLVDVSTNKCTYINKNRLSSNIPAMLNDQDQVQFGGQIAKVSFINTEDPAIISKLSNIANVAKEEPIGKITEQMPKMIKEETQSSPLSTKTLERVVKPIPIDDRIVKPLSILSKELEVQLPEEKIEEPLQVEQEEIPEEIPTSPNISEELEPIPLSEKSVIEMTENLLRKIQKPDKIESPDIQKALRLDSDDDSNIPEAGIATIEQKKLPLGDFPIQAEQQEKYPPQVNIGTKKVFTIEPVLISEDPEAPEPTEIPPLPEPSMIAKPDIASEIFGRKKLPMKPISTSEPEKENIEAIDLSIPNKDIDNSQFLAEHNSAELISLISSQIIILPNKLKELRKTNASEQVAIINFGFNSEQQLVVIDEAQNSAEGETSPLDQNTLLKDAQFSISCNVQGEYILRKKEPIELRHNGSIVANTEILQDGDIIGLENYSYYFFSHHPHPLQQKFHPYCQNEKLGFCTPFMDTLKPRLAVKERIKFSYNILGTDSDSLAFFTKENERGIYIFWAETLIPYPNYRLIPWLQGIFEMLLDSDEDCDQILKDFNQYIIQNCGHLPIYAMLFRFYNNDIFYSCAHAPSIIMLEGSGNNILFTPGMPLGLQKEIFLEQRKITYQPPQTMLFFTHSYFRNHVKEGNLVCTQQYLESFAQESFKQQPEQLLQNLSNELTNKIEIDHSFVLGTINFPKVPLVCPTCGAKYPRDPRNKFCLEDGTRLV